MMYSALIIGFLFGFVMQRSGFCGASLLSSVVLFKETRGLVGILLAILVSMLGFALLGQWDLIIPNPNPLRLLSAAVGGVVFGVGMVLAGGCVTGTLFKAGEGRLTSILALVGIGLGALAVTRGVLIPLKKHLVLATRSVRPPAGLNELVGQDYATFAIVTSCITLMLVAYVLYSRRDKKKAKTKVTLRRVLRGSWPVTLAGVLIGVIGCAAYVSSSAAGRNYPLGGIYGVVTAFGWLVTDSSSSNHWLMWQVLGIVAGSMVSARMRKDLVLRSADPATLLVALAGGVLVGIGATLGRGCFTGNMISGIALLSLHSAVFALCTVAANWVTTYLYLRGPSS